MSGDKRAHKRYAFPKSSDIRARLVLPDGHGSIETKVLNVSAGGLGLAAEKRLLQELAAETRLLVENISGQTSLSSLKGHTVQIKWVIDSASLENIGIGCEFVDLTNEGIEAIEELFAIRAES